MSVVGEAFPQLVELARQGGLLSIVEAAEIAEVSPRTVRSWIFAGKRNAFLVALRTGGRLRVTAGSLIRFLEETAVEDRNA